MMETNIDKIIYLLENALGVYSVYCFFEYFLKKKKISSQYFIVAYTLYIIVLGTAYLYYNNVIVNMTLSLICIFAVSFLYSSKLLRRILTTVLFYIIAMSSEIGVSFLFSMMKGSELTVLFQNSNSKLLMNGCSVLLLFMIVKIITCFMRKFNEVELPTLYWLAVFTIPSGSMFLLHVIFSYNIFFTHAEFHALTITAIVVVMVINCLVFYLYDKLLIDTVTRAQNTLLEQQIEYYAKQYEETENMQKEVNSIRHDIKNQLLGIQGYLKDKDYKRLEIHIENLLGGINRTKRLTYSGNAIIDSILYHKIVLAEKEDIRVDLSLRIPQEIEVSSNNFCIILGNALDNAIEACCNLDRQERKICIRMGYEHCALYLEISNPYKGELNFDSHGDLISSKEQKKNHGIGLKSIKKIIEGEEDFIAIDSVDQIFTLKILLFDKSEPKNLMIES